MFNSERFCTVHFFFGMILIYNGTDERQVFISVEMPYICGVTFFPSSFLISF